MTHQNVSIGSIRSGTDTLLACCRGWLAEQSHRRAAAARGRPEDAERVERAAARQGERRAEPARE